MYSHIMIGATTSPGRRNSTMPCLPRWARSPPRRMREAGWPLAQWRPFHGHKPIDGKPASQANGGTIGFSMKDAAQAEAWHNAGVANGGTSIEDPPGVRPTALISPICAIPTATSWLGLLARPADYFRIKTDEGRPSRGGPPLTTTLSENSRKSIRRQP